jgi:hypothetical protein
MLCREKVVWLADSLKAASLRPMVVFESAQKIQRFAQVADSVMEKSGATIVALISK